MIAIFLTVITSAFNFIRSWTVEETITKKVVEFQSDQLKQVAMTVYENEAKLNRHIEFTTKIDKDNAVLTNSMNNMEKTMNKVEETIKELITEVKGLAKEMREVKK